MVVTIEDPVEILEQLIDGNNSADWEADAHYHLLTILEAKNCPDSVLESVENRKYREAKRELEAILAP